jgi:hypothetical protein
MRQPLTNNLKADVNRLYIKRRSGGHGLVKLEYAYDAAIVGLSEYINPLPLLFKSLLPGQEDCVFSSGHLN